MALGFYLRWTIQNLRNHRMRNILTIVGVALAVAILVGITGFYRGYKESLRKSIAQLGFHVLVTAKGCPYEAATLILRGGQIPMYIDEQIYREVVSHSNVEFVARLFLQTLPSQDGDRFHFFMGVEDTFLAMKPWIRFQRGDWFTSEEADEVVLGYNVASYLNKDIGDTFDIPQFRRPFYVVGIIDRTGSQDDGTIFLPLRIAQKLFDKKDKLTGLGIRVKNVEDLDLFVEDIYDLPSVQVIATSQIQGTLLRLVESMRSVMLSIGICAALIAAISLMNTVLMSVFERTQEFGIMRALGGNVRHLFSMVCLETVILTLSGAIVGNGSILILRGTAEWMVRSWLPFSPTGHILQISLTDQAGAMILAVIMGVLCSLYPACRAARIRPQQSLRYGE